MLSNVSFSYRLPDGTLLWDGPVDLNSAAFSAKSSVLRVSVPSHQTNRSWSGPASWRPENPQVFVYGWFGNSTALSGKVVCDTPTPSALTRVATGNSSSTLLSRTNAAPPTDLFNGALSSFYVQGGVAFGSAGSACLDATSIAAEKFKSILNFSANLIDGSGNDNAAGFRHSFVLSSDGNFLTISNSATGRTMNGTLLPEFLPTLMTISFSKSLPLSSHELILPHVAQLQGGSSVSPLREWVPSQATPSLSISI
jgi:hypothetical protein